LPRRLHQFKTFPVSQQYPTPGSEIILYQTEDGRTRLEVKLESETAWLTQKQLAELFQKDVRTINEHIQNVFAEGELQREATIRKFRIVQTEGKRSVEREVEFYNLDAIIAVGYRVKSHRGTQFRQWATARLSEYIVKGFTMDDERLKNPPGKGQTDYFEGLLERIRDIRSSERRFYQKVLDIYATSVDYMPEEEMMDDRKPRIMSNTETVEIPIALDRFIQTVGITDTTAWRWRKKGWLETRNIAGRLYIAPKDLREFNRRMEAGEFAQEHKTPKRVKNCENSFAE